MNTEPLLPKVVGFVFAMILFERRGLGVLPKGFVQGGKRTVPWFILSARREHTSGRSVRSIHTPHPRGNLLLHEPQYLAVSCLVGPR